MVNTPGRILSGAFSKTQLLSSKVIKPRAICLFLLFFFLQPPVRKDSYATHST